jgi:N-acetylneuraminic acid mutarotase
MAYCAFFQSEVGLHFVGGGNGTVGLAESFLLDRQFRFHHTGRVPQSLSLSGAAGVADKLYIVGGAFDVANLATSSDVFCALHPGTGEVETLTPYPGGKIIVPAAAGLNGNIYVFGGASPGASGEVRNLNDSFIYSITDKRWTRGPSLPSAARGLASCVLDERHILVAGGYTERFSAECFIYDASSGRYSKSLSLPYAAMVSLVRSGDFVYCIGGEDKMKHRSADCYRIEWRKLLRNGP